MRHFVAVKNLLGSVQGVIMFSHLPFGEDNDLYLADAPQSSQDFSLPINSFQGPCEGV